MAAAFAVALLLPCILVLVYGLAGSQGNSAATGAATVATLAALALLAWRRVPTIDPCDGVVAILAAVAAVSMIGAGRNESIALALTLTAYAAARGLSIEDLPGIRRAVAIVAGAIVALGAPLIVAALAEQWHDPHGRPIVLGLPSAATTLATALGFLAIAGATARPERRGIALWCAALFVPAAIAAASMVRFALLATLGAMLLAAGLANCRRNLAATAAIALTITIGAACGLAARHQTAAAYLQQITLQPIGTAAAAPATAATTSTARMKCGVEIDNSVAIRKALIAQALALVPAAGPLGLGLDAFERQSCLGMPPHNTLLQTTIELGWIGGAALAGLIALAALRLVPIARHDRPAAFLLCALAYAAALSMVHGRTSREITLFLLLGAAAGVAAHHPSRKETPCSR